MTKTALEEAKKYLDLLEADPAFGDKMAVKMARECVTVLEREAKLLQATNLLIGYALSSRSHSTEWLRGLADKINAVAEVMGDTDKAMVQGEHLAVLRQESRAESEAK